MDINKNYFEPSLVNNKFSIFIYFLLNNFFHFIYFWRFRIIFNYEIKVALIIIWKIKKSFIYNFFSGDGKNFEYVIEEFTISRR